MFIKDGKNVNPETDDKESLHNIIWELKDEYFSDLKPEEIPNSDVSEVSDEEIQKTEKNVA